MAIKPLEKVLLNPAQVEEMKEDLQACQAQLQNPRVQDKGAVRDRMQRMQKQLVEEGASEGEQPTPQERDKLAKLEGQLRMQITQGMISEEEMRKCPSDAPNRLLRWEQSNIKKIEMWRNIRQQLDPMNPEAGNLEPFRPRGPQDRVRLDALIPGQMDYQSVPQERWDQTFDPSKKVESALDQAKKRHVKEKVKRVLTEDQKQQLRDRLKLARARKVLNQPMPTEMPTVIG